MLRALESSCVQWTEVLSLGGRIPALKTWIRRIFLRGKKCIPNTILNWKIFSLRYFLFSNSCYSSLRFADVWKRRAYALHMLRLLLWNEKGVAQISICTQCNIADDLLHETTHRINILTNKNVFYDTSSRNKVTSMISKLHYKHYSGLIRK